MPLCGFSDLYGMFDVTPVENLFIEEFLPRAPGEYIKVYLYGLRLCYHPQPDFGLGAMARTLSLREDEVRSAFDYWEKQGLVRRMSDNPPTYAYLNLKARLIGRGAPEDQQLYRYKEFNSALQALFGARILKPAEYTRASEWVEQLHMDEEAVRQMVRYVVESKGQKVTFAYLDKVAAEWAQNGITTGEAAEEYLRSRTAGHQGTVKILRLLGLRRAPTMAEEQLYAKWTGAWGFDDASVQAALSTLNNISNPNFAYLDKVLESLRKRGGGDVAAQLESGDALRDRVKELQEALGVRASPTKDSIRLYSQYIDKGFDHQALLLAATHLHRRGGSSLQKLGELLDRYQQMGLMTGEDIQRHLDTLAREREALSALKARAGDDSAITAADLRLYRAMEGSGLGAELISLAAEYAKGTRQPMAYAAKILEDWKAKGIGTAQAAKADHQARARGSGAAAAPSGDASQRRDPYKRVSAQQFGQREYSEQDIGALMLDIDSLEVEDG